MPRSSVLSYWGSGAHHGASHTLRDVAAWHASAGSADSDTLPDLDTLIPRARDIRRNNGFAQSIAQTSVDNIVGSGIRLCATPDYVALQAIDDSFDEDWADAWGEQWESIWHEYWWSTACDAGDKKTGDMISEEVSYSKFDNGGSFTLPLWLPQRGDGFATKLQTVEVDRLSNPLDAADTPLLRGGIEFNADLTGEAIAAHILKGHPGERFMWSQYKAQDWARIPRRTPWGRLRWIHDYDSDRPDQTRGKPWLSAVLDQFKNIDRYVKAEIAAAVSNANIWGAITTPLEHDEIVSLFRDNEEEYLAARNRHAVTMKANTLATLFPGDELTSFIPQRPATGFGVFVKNVQSIIAIGAGVPYVIAAKDFSESNYSNTRAAMLEGWRTFDRRRDRLGAGWLDPINGLLMEEMVTSGRIKAPEFYRFRRAYLRCTWIGPGQGYIDKVKEATGDQIMLDGDTETLQRIAARRGLHWRELINQRAMERKYAARKGLPDHTATRAANPPQVFDNEPPEDQKRPAAVPA